LREDGYISECLYSGESLQALVGQGSG